ncbi:MAG: MFS transporter [Cycloclasticus sp. symbiont of Bathymodiolus heckerae]|nr:MAG: MFS transporter [Cycloclasticus sp. symbiont of Bathymodiolus heckerae]
MTELEPVPYWRLSGVYFFYFATLGVLMPYLGLYLTSLGFVAAQIGIVFAVIQGTKVVAPNIWAWVAGRFSNRMIMVQIAALLSTAAFSFMLFHDSLFAIILICFVFSFFWNAMLPQFEAITLTRLGSETNLYSGIRLWGSVGFIATVAGVGCVLDLTSIDQWPLLVMSCLMMIFISSLLLNEKGRQRCSQNSQPVYQILKQKKVIAFLLVVFLIQASHGSYYAFFSILLKQLNYNEAEIGQLWSLGVIAEIVMFIVIQRFFHHVSLRVVLLLSIFFTVIRWLLIAWSADSLPILLVAQVLHAASFGAFHVACIQLTHRYFHGSAQEKGQALYSSVGYGAGGMFGSLISGLLWDDFGGEWVFTIASALSVVALYITWVWIEKDSADNLHASGDGVSSV